MNKIDIQVGDRITFEVDINGLKTTRQEIVIDTARACGLQGSTEYKILKIERPKYEVIEEKKELLTKEEKEFLEMYIKIIENLNNGKVIDILRAETRIRVYLETGLDYYIEVGPKFGNMKIDTSYTLEELGLVR